MNGYGAPLRDMRFLLHEQGLLQTVTALPGFEEASAELVDAILEEAGKLAADKLAPINHAADRAGGATLDNGVVRTSEGFADAYRAFVEGGWNAVPFAPDHGGQGLPWLVAIALQEMWQSANMSWALCPLLTQSAVELLQAHGSEEQKATWLARLISGEWSGTMNLTEAGAGSDVGALKCRAERTPDGHYLIRGQKIFITYGEHDMAENIVHMVLARTPDAAPGTKGISLFIVPKFLVKADGSLGRRNDLRAVSLEEKLGIHGSPTCVMAFGDSDGAVGYLVGEESRGMEYMFTMMNNARISVGLQGVAIAERAYQQARGYALERVQGKPAGGDKTIIGHPDVRRMLMTMRAQTEAMRAVTYDLAATLDVSRHHSDDAWRAAAERRVGLLTPVAKGWCTDTGVEVASLGIQIHGGMGYIEETGAAQHLRDARIAPIYEGTNGIQAIDLVGRKLLRDEGAAAAEYVEEVHALINGMNPREESDIGVVRHHLARAVDALDNATQFLLDNDGKDTVTALCAASHYLQLFGIVAGGAMLARGALRAVDGREAEGDAAFLEAKVATARFYAEQILPRASSLATTIATGRGAVMALPADAF